jgi:hypothetical protein
MNKLPQLFIVLGALCLIAALVGRYLSQNYMLFGIRALTYILGANTAFLLAILAKLFEKK